MIFFVKGVEKKYLDGNIKIIFILYVYIYTHPVCIYIHNSLHYVYLYICTYINIHSDIIYYNIKNSKILKIELDNRYAPFIRVTVSLQWVKYSGLNELKFNSSSFSSTWSINTFYKYNLHDVIYNFSLT